MSLVAFKKKSVIQYGSGRSGKPPGGYWLSQGPFGRNNNSDVQNNTVGAYGKEGFSIQGGHRNVGYVGKTYQMSKMGTPFRGTFPCWTSGGQGGTYKLSRPVYNVNEVIVLGDQYKYIKPSVLSTRGMLQKKYKWAYSGQYPNYWVQPNYTGNQSDSSSQGVYISTISAANDCVNDVNQKNIYINDIKKCGPTLCHTSTALFTYNQMASNAPYTKFINIPRTSGQRTLAIQKKCANPVGALKPFPYAVNGGSSNGVGSVSGVKGGNSGVCTLARSNFITPPAWYTSVKTKSQYVET